ncbi:uncharacterized protein NECHADRAFT_48216 [Fusarium vanettenii 77-13-4]|uniref:Zn(2)-C6 fungal-type domain-containing protein n=1 Tax=Fusarium vanettenii (strain ATCC MYA-4622 / CBS 123669 / FGSC 9596 / NRRL 45880 / 77-13-4) TaxID=660122 RepID=C7ZCS6_FUSV7|nr:uncharacterized protein NECHADRAFT_48216 [Fusarium vanettenii 77-13-4]EEU37972.1 hypothetical protein NECHADRAFT_48216 [Fusarium vanettenii 77-13-4]
MKRLGYKKSRNGCLQCKQRRCDESQPCCGACRRHHLPCSLTLGTDSNPIREGTSGQRRARKQRPSVKETIPFFPSFLHRAWHAGYPTNHTQVSDLELMHHYTAKAYLSVSRTPTAREALQLAVPREAFSSPCLLHQILAFSAFHLAYLRPTQRHAYLLAASQRQSQAVILLSSALGESLTPESCHSAYASSMFLVISAFATLPSFELYNPAFTPVDALADIFALVAGMVVILRCFEKDLREGPLNGLFGQRLPLATIQSHHQPLIERLSYVRACLSDDSLASSGEETSIAISASTMLIESIVASQQSSTVLGTPAELRAAFMWPIRLGNEFLDLMRNRNPPSMVIVAYYAVLLSYCETECWFLRRWAFALITSITESLKCTGYEKMITWCIDTIHEPSGSRSEL